MHVILAGGDGLDVGSAGEAGVDVNWKWRRLDANLHYDHTQHDSDGVGRIDIVENRLLGMKSRGVYETPGVTLLHAAHRAVESITLDREVQHLRDELIPRYAAMVYDGLWISPEREALQSFMDSIQRRVTGEARLKLYKGGV